MAVASAPGDMHPRVGLAVLCLVVLPGEEVFFAAASPPLPGDVQSASTCLPGKERGDIYYDLARHGRRALWRHSAVRDGGLGATPTSGSCELSIPSGSSAEFGFEVPDDAAFLSDAQLNGSARLWVEVQEETQEVPLVESRELSTTGSVAIDFSPYAGRFVSLRLRALDGDVTLIEPRVTAPHHRRIPVTRQPYNLLVFVVDTLRADRLAVYEPATRVRTPHLDRFAENAVVFERAFAPANWTKPSVATLLTGLQPWEHGATTHSATLPDHIPLLPELLQKTGYHTGAFAANGYISATFGFQRGWDSWRHRDEGPNDVRRLSAEVVRWLRRRPTDRPFFLYVHTTDCHAPYRPPPSVLSTYDPLPYRSGPADFRRHPGLLAEIRDGRLALAPRDRVHLEALYDGAITHHDRYFGAVIDELVRLRLGDDTVVLFVADHGEEFFDHGSVGHGPTLWNELIRIPLILRIPGLRTRLRLSAPVGSVDALPTLLDLLNVPVPAHVTGRSLLPEVEGRHSGLPSLAVAGIRGKTSLVSGRFKLLIDEIDGSPQPMLFDLVADPDERTSLADARPATVRHLWHELRLRSDPTATPELPAAVDSVLEAQLRALGYVGSQRME